MNSHDICLEQVSHSFAFIKFSVSSFQIFFSSFTDFSFVDLIWLFPFNFQGPLWSWSHGSWIYNYLCNQCLSPLTLWVWIPLRRGVLDTTLCDKVCQWLVAGQWFSPVCSTNKTEIVLKVALNTITLTLNNDISDSFFF